MPHDPIDGTLVARRLGQVAGLAGDPIGAGVDEHLIGAAAFADMTAGPARVRGGRRSHDQRVLGDGL